MDELKTYQQVNLEDESLSFGISKMEEISERLNKEPDEPHRHDFFTVIFTQEAKGKHIIDFNEYNLGANQVYFIAPGQVHQVIEERASVGFGVVFSNQFLVENNIPLSFIGDLNLFNHFGNTPPLKISGKFKTQIFNYLEDIYTIHHSAQRFKEHSIGALLKLVLVLCNNVCSRDVVNESKGSHILREFKALVDLNYKSCHSTSQYASELNISPDHLNRVVKSQTGKKAKEHIQSRIVVGAKRLLFFSKLSNKLTWYPA